MQNSATLLLENKKIIPVGELNFSNITALYEQSLPLINQCPELEFDFSRVTASNSAALALVMEWIKLAKKLQKSVHFTHLSAEILAIANVAGMNELIDICL